MNLHQLLLTKNDCYRRGQTMKPRGIMVHSTGANNPNLKRYVGPNDGLLGRNPYGNHWNNSGIGKCVHAFIGKLADGSIATYQTLPWNYVGWHAGASANSTHISFEICEDDLRSKSYFEAVYKEAAELCAMLCKKYNLTEKDIICHKEGYRKGIASNHGDVLHWWPKFGKDMDDFRAEVKKLLGSSSSESTTTTKKGYELLDEIKLVDGAKYTSGQSIPDFLFGRKLYVRQIRANGDIVFSTVTSGAVTGVIAQKYIRPYNDNVIVVPETEKEEPKVEITKGVFEVGDEVKLVEGAKYADGKSIPSWLFNKKKLYVREIRRDGNIVFSVLKIGAITGVVKPEALEYYDSVTSPKVEQYKDTPLKEGDAVKLVSGAKYISGQSIPDWVFDRTLYVREIRNNGDVVISTVKTGAVTGVVAQKYLKKV